MVALGQPARIGWLSALAAVLGLALFFHAVPSTFTRKQRFAAGACWFAAVQCIQLSWMTSIEYQGYYILAVYLFIVLWVGAQFGVLTPTRSLSRETLLSTTLLLRFDVDFDGVDAAFTAMRIFLEPRWACSNPLCTSTAILQPLWCPWALFLGRIDKLGGAECDAV